LKKQPGSFTGVGTVFMSDVINVAKLTEQLGPLDLIGVLNRHLEHVTNTIEKHKGVVIQFNGYAVLAFWHPEHSSPNHAQLAFDASREVLSTLPEPITSQTRLTYDVDIVLGTGDITGAFFGPSSCFRFQVVGKGMSIADCLSKRYNRRSSSIRMSQYTVALIEPKDGIEEMETISRDNLENLKVFMYCPVNKGMQVTSLKR
jgi:adenylate cyclase